jgi:hypothetical protein
MQETYSNASHTVGYKEFEIGYSLGLITTPEGAPEYHQIINKEIVPQIDKTVLAESGGLMTALSTSATSNQGDISDFLEPSSDVIYVLKLGVFSEPDIIDVRISIPSATTLYGIKSSNTGKVNGLNSPIMNPTVVVYSYGTSLIPNFTFENNSNTALTTSVGFMKISVSGHRYRLAQLDKPPKTASIINLAAMGSD